MHGTARHGTDGWPKEYIYDVDQIATNGFVQKVKPMEPDHKAVTGSDALVIVDVPNYGLPVG